MGRLLGLPDKITPELFVAGSYEFDQFQNHTFRNLAKAMRFVGVFTVVIGILYGIGALYAITSGHIAATVVGGVQSAISIVLGLYLTSASANLMRIVDTTGQDIANLMAGMEQLRRYFTVQMVLIIILLCAMAASLLLYLAI